MVVILGASPRGGVVRGMLASAAWAGWNGGLHDLTVSAWLVGACEDASEESDVLRDMLDGFLSCER